ncbi:hypothetical protein N7508_011237 [Penicillium antarcticum]|uniref:uncharacterized protein n=1 Tax=Penicillium antarcticum TaxID=416450 RepID=UPI0023A15FCA|nr:uncharacterized protein N7508_011237 [Penicillium antarcticum]KAJ5286583.1 hypothetical protein N7508_011237 [Penicillium antarcticum]
MASGQSSELANLTNRSSNMKDIFDDIASYFKNNTGKTIERNEDLFARGAQEMKEFTLALQSSKIQLMFANVTEPKNTAKQAYYNSRQQHSNRSFQRGTSSRLSSTVGNSAKKNIGFADDSDEETKSKSTTQPATPIKEPATPTPMRGSAIKSERSTGSHVGFADDSDDDMVSKVKQPTIFEEPPSGNSVLSDDEVMDLSFVCDFINEHENDYDVDAFTQEFLDSARKSKRAASGPALELLLVIRKMRETSGPDSIPTALGLDENGNVDTVSDVVQWILNQKKSS